MAVFVSLLIVLLVISYFAGLKLAGFMLLFSATIFGALIFHLFFPDDR